jgi:filamentous hemagglutinin family protein
MKTIKILLLILAMLSWTASGRLFALPQGEIVESGSATFERPDPSMTNNIPTLNIFADDRSVINFDSFNIAQNEAVYFIQPSAASSVLSRVQGLGVSEIAGILSANGTLFLVNQNGVHFSQTAQVNVKNLVASTLDISTNNFVNGNYILEHAMDSTYAQILNHGRLTGDNIALVASGVHNDGLIVARAGTAHLSSGDKVTVSFDQRGLIQVEVNEQTSGGVVDLNGSTVKDAIANSGTIEAREVVMSSRTASGIFENAVNQTGVVKATGITQDGGVIRIRSNRNVQVSGSMEAPQGGIQVSSEEFVSVKAALQTKGNTNIMADKDIEARANISTSDGKLSLLADADLDGTGTFKQSAGTLISTINYGDIIIQSSGQGTLADISSAGDLILKQGGAAAVFTQHPGSRIFTAGSMSIGQGVTVNAANSIYSIGKNWINAGIFTAQDSLVSLVSDKPALVQGSTIFNDFRVIVPGKKVTFTAGDMITVVGILTLQGSYGNLLTLVSTEPGEQWKILPLGNTDIAFSQIGDCYNARGPPLKVIHSSSLGNNSNLDLDPFWTGQGFSFNWSDPDNWDTGTVPTAFDIVTFDGITGLNPNKDSFIDPAFGGAVANFYVNGYGGLITLQRDLTVSGNISLQTGVLSAGSYTITVGGDWSAKPETFLAGTSTVVFNDSSKISYLTGNTVFYDLTCITPGKKLMFGSGTLTIVENTLTIEGSNENHIILNSSTEAKGNEFGIYIGKVSDKEGNAYLEYLDVYYSIAYGPTIPVPAKHYYIPAELNTDWDDTHTWSGTASNLWNLGGVGGNWNGAVVPVAGDDLVFPNNLVSGRYSTSNDIAAATSFNSITIQGNGYTLAGNSITLAAGGITDSYVGGANTISLPIVLSGTRTITVTDAGETLTLSGIISGATFGITKAGAGKLTQSNGANSYTGVTTINAGILSVSTLAAGGANSGIGAAATSNANLVLGGGTLQYTGATVSTSRGFTLTAGTTSTIEVTSAAAVLTMSTASANTNGNLTKTGSGTLTFTAAMAYTGTTTINAGTLKEGIASSLSTGGVTVNSGGTFDWNSFADSIGALIVNDGGVVTCSGAGAILTLTSTLTINSGSTGGSITTGSGTLTLGGNVSSTGGATNALISGNLALGATRTITVTDAADGLTISAVISGNTFGITKAGSGKLTLSGTNTYTGQVLINAGTLSVNLVAASGTNSPLGTGAGTAAISIAATGILQYTGTGHSTNRAIILTGSGGTIDASGSGLLTLTGGVTGNTFGLVLTGTGTGTFTTGIIATTTGTLTKNGSGTWTLGVAASTYSGSTTINAGTLKAGIANAFPTVAFIVNNGGTYDWSSYADTIGALTVNDGGLVTSTGTAATLTISSLAINSGAANGGGAIATGLGTLTLGGNVTSTGGAMNATITGKLALGAARIFTVTNAQDGLTITAVISGAFALTKEGAGTLALNGANSYTGITTLNAGTLSVLIMRKGGVNSGVGASAAAATNLIFNGGTFQYTGGTASTDRLFSIGTTSPVTLDASGDGLLTFSSASAMTLLGTNAARTITFTGTGSAILTNIIPDNGTGATTVVKNGTGAWAFYGVNTYTGVTTINAGTLKIAADTGVGAVPGAATPGDIVLNGGALQSTATFTLHAYRGISLTGAGSILTDVGTVLTYSGIIAGTGAFTKGGDGELILQGVNTYNSATVVDSGTLTFSGANGSALSSTSFTINAEAVFSLDNTSANSFDRIGDGVDISMNGGYFNFIGCSSAASFETVGALNIVSGSNYVSIRDSIGGATIMTFSSFSRIAGSMVLFRGTNFGSAPGDNVSTIMFTAAPVLTGGGGNAGTTTVSIIQGAFGSGSPTGTGTDMVTYNIADNTFGLRMLNEGGFTGEYETSVLTVPNSNVKLTTSVAPGAGITINSLILRSGGAVASSANTLTIGSGNILALLGNGGINGTTVLAFGTNPGIIRAVDDLTISSQITGSAGLTTGGAGTITLSNASNSFTGGIRIAQGIVKISADAQLGLGGGAGYITIYAGTLQTTATFALNSGRGILLNGPGSISVDTATILTYNGIIAGPHSLIKDGEGSLLLGGANTYAGDTTVNAGTLTLSEVNTYGGATIVNGMLILSGANGAVVNTSSVTINAGGTLTLDNSAANNVNRIANGAAINMNGGSLNFIGSAAVAASETVGALLFASGDNKITVTPGTGGSTVLTFANFTRNSGATGLFRGTSLGIAPAANVSTIYFDDDPDLVGGGGAAGTTTISIIPGAFGDGALAGTGTDMVTYTSVDNGGYGLRLLSSAANEYSAAFTANTNVRLTASIAPGSTLSINSLILVTNGVVATSNRTVTIASGNILNTSAAGIITNTTIITFLAAEGIIYNTNTLAFRSNIANTSTGGLTFCGPGTTTLNTLVKSCNTGMLTVNTGTLVVGINAAINSAMSVTVTPGATVSMSTFIDTITSLILYSGTTNAATVTSTTGTLTLLAAGGGSVTLNVNGSGAVGATIGCPLALGASRIFTVNDGSAANDLTVNTVISGNTFGITKNGAGTLVLGGNNTYTGANIINAGTLAVTANNALGTNAAGTTVNAGILDFRNVAYGTTEAVTLATGSSLITSTGTSSFAGAITMTAPAIVQVEGTQLTLSGAIANGGYRLTVDGAGNAIISNTLTGTGGLAKQGLGTLTLSNTVTLGGNLSIARGTLVLGANTVTVSGNWTNNATFTCGTSTVTFNGGSSTIDSGGTGNGQAFYKVVINTTSDTDTKTLASAIMINNVLQVDKGILAGDCDVTVGTGSVTGNGTITMTDGTFTVLGAGSFGNATANAWTFYNLTFGDGSDGATTAKAGTNTIVVTRQLSVLLTHTLQAGNSTTWNLVWTSYLKNIVYIASGYDHTIALTDDGYVFSWGNNEKGQLGDGTIINRSTPVQVKAGEQVGEFLSTITKIAAGGYHSVALASDGTVFTWGYNASGQLGSNNTTDEYVTTPVLVHDVDTFDTLSGIASIAAGGNETAAVSTVGFVYCWGDNELGTLGNNATANSPYPVQVLRGEQPGVTYLHDISMVSVGGIFVIALGTDGSVYSWGSNVDGQLGIGTTDALLHATPVQVHGLGGAGVLNGIYQISAGEAHSLALATTGFVYSWGWNGWGQLGDGTLINRPAPVLVQAGEQGTGNLKNVTAISAGSAHNLVIADGGYVYSWGQNIGPFGEPWGQLGDGTTVSKSLPVYVHAGVQGSEQNLHGISRIAAGGAQTVALYGARVFNCGNNKDGQLGNGLAVSVVEQIRVQAGSQLGPVIQLNVLGYLTNQTAIFNIYISAVNYTNLTISSNNSANYWLSGNTIVTGNLFIDNATLNAGSYNIEVSGDWTNTAGTFNAGTGTVTLNGTQKQSVTSGGSTFNILTVTNVHVSGVEFVDTLVTAYLNAGSGVKKLSFAAASAGSPNRVTAGFNVAGSAGNLIELAPRVGATPWYIEAPTTSLKYLKISYSYGVNGIITATNSQETVPGSNTNWVIN